MEFEGEHLLPGKIGHFFVLLAFTTSLLATIAFFIASRKQSETEKASWLKYARINFIIQSLSVFTVFGCIFYICSNHYLEYFYAYKHTSNELEFKYLLACIWEDQGGSFLLWSIWHCVLGFFIISRSRKPESATWEAPVMTIVSSAQVFLALMIMGVELLGVKFGNSPFVLTRNEINGPIFSRPDYLSMLKDGIGLNVLLRNYWMVIHPPILFLGFASTIIPFGFAYAGIQTKRFGDWVKPAIPYAIFSAAVLGTGIMMGGKWAYESLSFGGYWGWDPVENASLVPWMIMVAGLHTMLIYQATGHSLRTSYLFVILSFVFILYSTFLTRTGILGDTSVHAFTEAGKAMNILILTFFAAYTLFSLTIFFASYRKIPAIKAEEKLNSREFWMFIGSLVFFLSALFIIAKTSTPVINSVFHSKIAPPEDVEFSYNRVMVLVAFIIGILTAVSQYFRYKDTPGNIVLKKIALPTLIAALIAGALAFIYPITYYKQGPGFLGAIYIALFASIYAVVANIGYIWSGLNGKFKSAGGSVTHIGFGLMVAGMLISSGNKKVISEERFKTIDIQMGIDPQTKQQDNPAENINLIRQLPNKMGKYTVTYLHDSLGHETGRRYYHILFQEKDTVTGKIGESFVLSPDVYIMKDNNMSSNPDTKNYLTHDIFTYISYALNPEKNKDTSSFTVNEVAEGDTMFYSKGFMVLNKVIKNPAGNKFNIIHDGPSVIADITVKTNDSNTYHATPMLLIDSMGIRQVDDTVYAQSLYLRFDGVTSDLKKLKIGVKESKSLIDFISLKAYVFPYINLVWLGLIIMTAGMALSLGKRIKLSPVMSVALVFITTLLLFYMFLVAS